MDKALTREELILRKVEKAVETGTRLETDEMIEKINDKEDSILGIENSESKYVIACAYNDEGIVELVVILRYLGKDNISTAK